MSMESITNWISSCERKSDDLFRGKAEHSDNLTASYLSTASLILQGKLVSYLQGEKISKEEYFISSSKALAIIQKTIYISKEPSFDSIQYWINSSYKRVKNQLSVTQIKYCEKIDVDIIRNFAAVLESKLNSVQDINCSKKGLNKLTKRSEKIAEKCNFANKVLTYVQEGIHSQGPHPIISLFQTKIEKLAKNIKESLEDLNAGETIKALQFKVTNCQQKMNLFGVKNGINQETREALELQFTSLNTCSLDLQSYLNSQIDGFINQNKDLESNPTLKESDLLLDKIEQFKFDNKLFFNDEMTNRVNSLIEQLNVKELCYRKEQLTGQSLKGMNLEQLKVLEKKTTDLIREINLFLIHNEEKTQVFIDPLHALQDFCVQIKKQLSVSLTSKDLHAALHEVFTMLQITDISEVHQPLQLCNQLKVASAFCDTALTLDEMIFLHKERIAVNEEPTIEEFHSALQCARVELLIDVVQIAINEENHQLCRSALHVLESIKLDPQQMPEGFENLAHVLHEKGYHKQVNAHNQGKSSINPNDWGLNNKAGRVIYTGTDEDVVSEELPLSVLEKQPTSIGMSSEEELEALLENPHEEIDHSDHLVVQESVSKEVKLEALHEFAQSLKKTWYPNA